MHSSTVTGTTKILDPTSLVRAARFGDLPGVRHQLSRNSGGGSDVNWRDNAEGRSALLAAVEGGHVPCVHTLLVAGAVLTDRLKHNHGTALHIACSAAEPSVEMVKLLLTFEHTVLRRRPEDRPEVDARCVLGRTALHTVLWNQEAAAAAATTASSTATTAAITAIVALLLEHGAHPHRLDDIHQFNAMMVAAHTGNVEAIRYLAQVDASLVNLVPRENKRGVTPLMLAARAGHDEAVRALIELSADLDVQDKKGRPARCYTLNCSVLLHKQIIRMTAEKKRTLEPCPQNQETEKEKKPKKKTAVDDDRDRMMIEVRYSRIPSYLHASAHFQNMDRGGGGEDDGTNDGTTTTTNNNDLILVPAHCFAPTDAVFDVSELRRLLEVMKFWCLAALPATAIEYCAQHDVTEWDSAVEEVFGADHQMYRDLVHTFQWDIMGIDTCPLSRAIETGRRELVQYLILETSTRTAPDPIMEESTAIIKLNHMKSAMAAAAACQNEEWGIWCLQAMRAATTMFPYHPSACAAAARQGNMNCLRHLFADGCPWDFYATIAGAARAGRPDMMQFILLEHRLLGGDIPSSRDNDDDDDDDSPAAVVSLAAVDRWMEEVAKAKGVVGAGKACLEFALRQGFPLHPDACTHAANHLECLTFLRSQSPPAPWTSETTLAAARAGNLVCLTYLHRGHCPWDVRVPEAAAQRGDVHTLRYAIGNWCPYDADLMRSAAAGTTGTTGTRTTSAAISKQRRLACLKYLIGEQGMYMNDDGSVFGAALMHGDLACVRYLINFDCPFRPFQFVAGEDRIRCSLSEDGVEDRQAFDREMHQCLTLAYRFGWRWNEALVKHISSLAFLLPKCRDLVTHAVVDLKPAHTVPPASLSASWRDGFLD